MPFPSGMPAKQIVVIRDDTGNGRMAGQQGGISPVGTVSLLLPFYRSGYVVMKH